MTFSAPFHIASTTTRGCAGIMARCGADRSGETRLISETVHTTQIAPTILSFLGLDPQALQSVRIEHTSVLPGIGAAD